MLSNLVCFASMWGVQFETVVLQQDFWCVLVLFYWLPWLDYPLDKWFHLDFNQLSLQFVLFWMLIQVSQINFCIVLFWFDCKYLTKKWFNDQFDQRWLKDEKNNFFFSLKNVLNEIKRKKKNCETNKKNWISRKSNFHFI